MQVDAQGLTFRELNKEVGRLAREGVREIKLVNVNGHRYIGAGLEKNNLLIEVHSTPGNDLGTFMNGPTIIVHGNAEDGVGNTMNSGRIVVYGDARDIVGYSMRGGEIFIKGNVGYRVGIHMKAYGDHVPTIVVGGSAGDFLGEYMAGGIIAVLNLQNRSQPIGSFAATGIHGGAIFVRGEVEKERLGIGAEISHPNQNDLAKLRRVLAEYCSHFDLSLEKVAGSKFTKIHCKSHRPFGKLYILE